MYAEHGAGPKIGARWREHFWVAPSLLGRCALDGHSHLPRTLLLPATHTMDCSLTKRWEQAPKICAFSFVCEWVCSMLPGSMKCIGDRCAAGYRLSFAAQSAFSNYPHYRMLFDEAVGLQCCGERRCGWLKTRCRLNSTGWLCTARARRSASPRSCGVYYSIRYEKNTAARRGHARGAPWQARECSLTEKVKLFHLPRGSMKKRARKCS